MAAGVALWMSAPTTGQEADETQAGGGDHRPPQPRDKGSGLKYRKINSKWHSGSPGNAPHLPEIWEKMDPSQTTGSVLKKACRDRPDAVLGLTSGLSSSSFRADIFAEH